MTNIIIIGAGGHAAELDEYIAYSNSIKGIREYNIVGFLDDNSSNFDKYKFSAPYLGGVRDHQVRTDCLYLMCIANTHYKRLFAEQYCAQGAQFLTYIHPNAYVSPTAILGKGVIIAPMANLGPNVKVGDFSLINSRSSLGHDVEIGCYNFISPNTSFSGFTRVGDENLFGINSATIPSVCVGNRNKIAAGMVLDKNIGDDEVVFYRYKERVIAVPKQDK